MGLGIAAQNTAMVKTEIEVAQQLTTSAMPAEVTANPAASTATSNEDVSPKVKQATIQAMRSG